MRSNLRILAALLFVGWLSFCPACSDDLTQVGSSTLPDGDRNTVYSDTFQMTAATVRVDSLYLRSSDGMLGNLDDPAFGQIKYDYLCQFYCAQGFRFPHTPHNGRIDSVVLRLRFYNWTGDARVSMRARVYALNRQPVRSPYGRLNPEDYADMQTVLGTRVYRLTDFPSLGNDSTIRDLYNASTRSYQQFTDAICGSPCLSRLGSPSMTRPWLGPPASPRKTPSTVSSPVFTSPPTMVPGL